MMPYGLADMAINDIPKSVMLHTDSSAVFAKNVKEQIYEVKEKTIFAACLW